MTTKQMHTPGPWRIHSKDPAFAYIEGNDALDGKTGIVARVLLTGDDFSEANANLIAAAPELLEALRHAETALIVTAGLTDESGTKIIKDGYGYELKQIRAAIAKAEGR